VEEVDIANRGAGLAAGAAGAEGLGCWELVVWPVVEVVVFVKGV
jgi:hypothetical protein